MAALATDALLVLLLTLHLAAVSIAAIGPLFAIYCQRRQARGDAWSGLFGRLLARRAIEFLILGMLLGLAQLTLLWLAGRDYYLQALSAIEVSRWWFAGIELLFSLACLVVYWATWNRWQRWRWLHAAVAFVAATNIAYHFPTLFVIVGVVGQRPELWDATVSIRSLLLDGEVLARVVHFLIAAVAVCSVYVVWQAARLADAAPASAGRVMEVCGRVALGAVFLQLPLGVVLLVQMPDAMRQELLGGSAATTVLFGGSVAVTIALLHHLGAMAFGDLERGTIRRSLGLTLLVLLLMIGTRHRSRHESHLAAPHRIMEAAVTLAPERRHDTLVLCSVDARSAGIRGQRIHLLRAVRPVAGPGSHALEPAR